MKKLSRVWWCSALVPLACTGSYRDPPPSSGTANDPTAVVRSEKTPPPIMGGTLLVTADRSFAIASDPDRDLVHIIDLAKSKETATIALEAGALPFRGVQDSAGLVHITLRGEGKTIRVDPRLGTVVSEASVCPNPRGIAYDAQRDVMLVACAGGELVTTEVEDGSVIERRYLETDIRDVFVQGDEVFVSQFRAAEVLAVTDEGVALRGAPLSLSVNGKLRAPNTAWRTLPTGDGGWLMLHQLANTTPLELPDEEGGEEGFDDGSEEGSAYGGAFGLPCEGVVNPAVSLMRPDGTMTSGGPIAAMALAVDAAISPDGKRVVVASPSQFTGDVDLSNPISLFSLKLRDFNDAPSPGCTHPDPVASEENFVAVAFNGDDEILALTRDRPRLIRFSDDRSTTIELAGPDATDTGHDLFHLDAGNGVSCASCHPEGGDDGRIWTFEGLGPRRTQPLNVGLAGTEPFHWQGDMDDMHVLVDEVRQRRMGGREQNEPRKDALQDWIFSIEQANPLRSSKQSEAVRGEALFASLKCDTCHSGASFTSNAFVDFGAGPLQIPNLHGVALHGPYMHDGRSADLTAATWDMIERTPDLPEVSDDDVAAVVAYLETL